MLEIFAVGAGGFIGAILRHLISGWTQRAFGESGFPIGTLVVNLVGCLIIGLLAGLTETREIFSPHIRLMIFIGILGSFTTFSTFGHQTHMLLRDGHLIAAASSILLHIILGMGAAWGGYALTTISTKV
jgi:CrcB protein